MSTVHEKPTAEAPNSKRAKLASASTAAAAAAANFVAPADWPAAGPINLDTADLPHDSADTEWWYVNGHVTDDATGHDLSFFASFFRIAKAVHADGTMSDTHTHTYHTQNTQCAHEDTHQARTHSKCVYDPASAGVLVVGGRSAALVVPPHCPQSLVTVRDPLDSRGPPTAHTARPHTDRTHITSSLSICALC